MNIQVGDIGHKKYLMRSIVRFFRRLFCRHKWDNAYLDITGTLWGRGTTWFIDSCEKCRKIKTNLQEPIKSQNIEYLKKKGRL